MIWYYQYIKLLDKNNNNTISHKELDILMELSEQEDILLSE